MFAVRAGGFDSGIITFMPGYDTFFSGEWKRTRNITKRGSCRISSGRVNFSSGELVPGEWNFGRSDLVPAGSISPGIWYHKARFYFV